MDKHLDPAAVLGAVPATILTMPSAESHPYPSLSLPELLDLFPDRIQVCESKRDLESVFEICRLSRSAWATYLREYSKNGAPGLCERIVGAMEAGRRVMAQVTQELPMQDRALAARSVINVQRRLRFADVLREGGMDGLIDEMFKHLDERLSEAA